MTYGEAGRGLGEHPNRLRYAAPTGTVLIRWDGARQPTVWTVPAPEVDPREARLELARRYLHVFGPTTPEAFAQWAGIAPAQGRAAFDALSGSLTPARTPIGDGWILTRDEPTFRAPARPASAARLLPSGDAYFLLQGADRELLVPERRSSRRALDPARLARRRPASGARSSGRGDVRGHRHDPVLAATLAGRTRRGRGGGASPCRCPACRGRILVRWDT